MDRTKILWSWSDAIASGIFGTRKHYASSFGTLCPGYRTVIVSSQPETKNILSSGNDTLRQYRNNSHTQSPNYLEIDPNDRKTVARSGIQPNSLVLATGCSRCIAVSGTQQGWHLNAEQSTNIQSEWLVGTITYLTELL